VADARVRAGVAGRADSFRGYGLFGQAFASGDLLAFRRYDWSSIGPPFTTVWHRRPNGRWTCHTNVEPDRSCARYFGLPEDTVRRDGIDIVWRGSHELSIHVHAARLRLALRLAASPDVRLVSVLAGLVPEPIWRLERHARWIGRALGHALGAGPIQFVGSTPSGHRLLVKPRELWRVAAAVAVLDGRELGESVPVEDGAHVLGLPVPRTGLLFRGMATAATPALPADAATAARRAYS
jgi:hypothetical protein